MDTFKERESAAEALYIHQIEAEFAARMRRVRRLGSWASGMMGISQSDEDRYQDVLYRLAISSPDDRVIVDRVYDDLAASGMSISRTRVSDVLGHDEAPSS